MVERYELGQNNPRRFSIDSASKRTVIFPNVDNREMPLLQLFAYHNPSTDRQGLLGNDDILMNIGPAFQQVALMLTYAPENAPYDKSQDPEPRMTVSSLNRGILPTINSSLTDRYRGFAFGFSVKGGPHYTLNYNEMRKEEIEPPLRVTLPGDLLVTYVNTSADKVAIGNSDPSFGFWQAEGIMYHLFNRLSQGQMNHEQMVTLFPNNQYRSETLSDAKMILDAINRHRGYDTEKQEGYYIDITYEGFEEVFYNFRFTPKS